MAVKRCWAFCTQVITASFRSWRLVLSGAVTGRAHRPPYYFFLATGQISVENFQLAAELDPYQLGRGVYACIGCIPAESSAITSPHVYQSCPLTPHLGLGSQTISLKFSLRQSVAIVQQFFPPHSDKKCVYKRLQVGKIFLQEDRLNLKVKDIMPIRFLFLAIEPPPKVL